MFSGDGNIFSVGIDGSNYDDLYNFSGGTTDGSVPLGDLTPSGGTLFGMTSNGGAHSDGIIFALSVPGLVPEPGTLALVGCGAAVLLSYRWRRMRRRKRR